MTNHPQSEQESILVYLLAASHSGSTLTAMLLNAHPEIRSAGELKATDMGDPDRYRCSCQSPIRSCNFWDQVAQQMNVAGLEFDICHSRTSLSEMSGSFVQRLLRPLHRGRGLEAIRDGLLGLSASWRKELPVWRIRNRELIRSVSKVSGCKFVVDSSKRGIRLKYLLRDEFTRIKVVRIVRDGRAVALTYIDPDRFADASDPSLRGGGSGATANLDVSMARAATEWRRSNEEAEAIMAGLAPGQAMQITYENLCVDPLATLNSVYDFLGVSQMLEIGDFRTADHHVIGNGMRLDKSAKVVLDERWREVLNTDELLEFDKHAGELNRKYGYL